MQQETYEISTMSRNEVELMIDWAAREGWNPGIHDAECFYAADPNGFLVGLLNDEPIATISAVKYGDSFGFIGLYIVKPEYRGKGYGTQLLRAATQYLEGRNIGLDGVVAQQDNYRKYGFKLAYRNVRYEGQGSAIASESTNEFANLASLPLEEVDAYDRAFFPEPRTDFLNCWINQGDCKALGIMQNGRLAGYGVLRKCRSGYKIGPLFADTPALAESLFLKLRSGLEATELFYLDVPEVNREAIELAERYAMKVVFETARMYTGPEPDIGLNRLYGVTSFELG
ncbi:GNAT family N-acetyltransferase [Azotobacter armeniacus]